MVLGVYYYQDHCYRNRDTLAIQSMERLSSDMKVLAIGDPAITKNAPSFMTRVPLLRNARTVLNYDKNEAFLRDMFFVLSQQNDPIIIYSNIDVIFNKSFPTEVKKLLEHYDAVSISSRQVEDSISIEESFNKPNVYPLWWGIEVFALKIDAYRTIEPYLPDFLIGEHKWDLFLKNLLRQKTKLFHDDSASLCSHVIHDRPWEKPSIGHSYNSFLSDPQKIPEGEPFCYERREYSGWVNTTNRLALVFCITKNWAFALGTVLLSIKRMFLGEYDVIVYHDGIPETDMVALDRIHPCIFRRFSFDISKNPALQRISHSAFAKFHCFSLLSRYRKVVYLDVDIVILKSFDTLVNICNSGMGLFLHKDIPNRHANFRGYQGKLENYDLDTGSWNSGVMIFNDDIPQKEQIETWCYKIAKKYIELLSGDQGVINLAVQEFNIPVTPIPEEFNCRPEKYDLVNFGKDQVSLITPNTCIIHTWFFKKPWESRAFEQWNRNYDEWVELGGTVGSVRIERVTERANISTVTTFMNRNRFLAQSLPTWIAQPFKEIVIVDWSSTEDIFSILPRDPRIKVLRVDGQEYFNNARAHNLGVRNTANDIIMCIDADIILMNNFRFEDLQFSGNEFLQGQREGHVTHIWGTCVFTRKQFLKVNGYSENIEDYGFEDDDYFYRLEAAGYIRKPYPQKFLQHIEHSDVYRTLHYREKNKFVTMKRNQKVMSWTINDKQSNTPFTVRKAAPP